MRSHLLSRAAAAYKHAVRTAPVYTSEGWLRAAEMNSAVSRWCRAGGLCIPAGPVRSNQTALAEEASHWGWPLSPVSSAPCPSPASQPPIAASWSGYKWKVIFVATDHHLPCRFTDTVSRTDKEDPTFSASLRDAVILDFLYGNKQHFHFFSYKATIGNKSTSCMWRNTVTKCL